MEIKKFFGPLVSGFWMLIVVLLFSSLLYTTILGFPKILSDFRLENNGTNILISFIVFSLTLSLLSYTIPVKDEKKEKYKELGRKFTVNGILMFTVSVSFKGFNLDSQFQLNQPQFGVLSILSLSLFYIMFNFILLMFQFLIELTSFQEKISKVFIDLKEWYVSYKGLAITVLLIYSLVMTWLVFRN